jgi:hypothetical protein
MATTYKPYQHGLCIVAIDSASEQWQYNTTLA